MSNIRKFSCVPKEDTQNLKSKSDHEDIVNNAFKMIILNNAIGILLKLPLCFRPIINAIAQFYYENDDFEYTNPQFARFLTKILFTRIMSLIHEASELFFTLFISLQFYIYLSFDKKFKLGYLRWKYDYGSMTNELILRSKIQIQQ